MKGGINQREVCHPQSIPAIVPESHVFPARAAKFYTFSYFTPPHYGGIGSDPLDKLLYPSDLNDYDMRVYRVEVVEKEAICLCLQRVGVGMRLL
jgi:hypothetical protein